MLINRIRRMLHYAYRLNKGFPYIHLIASCIRAVKPFILLWLSQIIIKGIMVQQPLPQMIQKAILLLSLYFVLSLLEGFFKHRTEYHRHRFRNLHQISKAEKMLSLDYEYAENDQIQEQIATLKNLEKMRVFGIFSFEEAIGNIGYGLVSGVISLIFAIQLFASPITTPKISNTMLNIVFISLLVLLQWINMKTISRMNTRFGAHISNTYGPLSRYLEAYSKLIFSYKSGKDIRLYHKKLAHQYSQKYCDLQDSIYIFFCSFFSKISVITEGIGGLSTMIIFLYISVKALYGPVDASWVFLYIGVIQLLIRAMIELVDATTVLYNSDDYRRQLFSFYDLQVQHHEGQLPLEKRLDDEYLIECKDVSFMYPGTNTYVLRHINLSIPIGKKLAIVGENGSGKTTLIKLLVRLYEPTEGVILLNGIDIRTYRYEEYIQLFSVVFQDFQLLALPLGENIAASDQVDTLRATAALQKVGMDHFVEQHGLEAYLYKDVEQAGIEISGGESQKIALARAIYKAGKLFVLDEPTAALDPIAEHEIYQHFNDVTLERTSVYISHRLSSCIFCDNVVVLNQGQIVQKGTHQALLEQTGELYEKLWNAQAKHYQ